MYGGRRRVSRDAGTGWQRRSARTRQAGERDSASVNLTGVSEALQAVPSWRPGHFVWPTGGTKLVLFGGIGTSTGEPERSFAGMLRYLSEHGGYDLQRDVLEGTYAGRDVDGTWEPTPYVAADTRRPLIDAADAVAGCLDWYRARLPPSARLCLLGYSLGGVVGIDGATLAIARDRQTWQNRIGAVVTFAAPVRGCSVGALIHWAWLITAEPEALGDAGHDLEARWRDTQEQTRLERRVAFLRAAGARVLTLVDPEDSVVRPEEGLLPAPGEALGDLEVRTVVRRPGSLGHGAILDEPAAWRRVLAAVGPQPRRPEAAASRRDPIEDELQALKARLRREGRIR